MAQIKFLKGLNANLGEVPYVEGQIIFVTDTKKIYLDNGSTSADRIELYSADLADLLSQIQSKQDILEFEGAYDKQTNKAVTKSAMDTAIAAEIKKVTDTLTGAMHFIGTSTTDPKTEVTVEGHEDFEAGDVVLYGNKEYVYDGKKWVELGDEGSYLLKNSEAVTDADIADEAISMKKINGLEDALDALVGTEDDNADSDSIEGAKRYTDDAIDELTQDMNNTDTAQSGYYVSAVKQTNGAVTVTREPLPSLAWEDFPVATD